MQVTLGGVNSKFYMKIVGYHKSVVIENRYHKYHNVVLSVVLCVVMMTSEGLCQPLNPKIKMYPPYLPLEVSKNV
jgi:hypothetical protein